jgi:hypothetical protein
MLATKADQVSVPFLAGIIMVISSAGDGISTDRNTAMSGPRPVENPDVCAR